MSTPHVLPRRLIPFFLLKGHRLVKGTQFAGHVDVGDPVSQAMIYDAQGAEEVAIVDIEASAQGRTIEPKLITKMISTCRLPIAAGGGIRSVADGRRCFAAGADKIIVNSHAVSNPRLVRELALEFGAQSVVVSLDVRKEANGRYRPVVFGGAQTLDRDVPELLEELETQGAGEVVLTAVDREGTLEGLDIDLYAMARSRLRIPLIASGGAGSYPQLVELFRSVDLDGVALGKMLFLRDYDIVRIKAFLRGRKIPVREA